MTIIDKLLNLAPELNEADVVYKACPWEFFMNVPEDCKRPDSDIFHNCKKCWNQTFNDMTMAKTYSFDSIINNYLYPDEDDCEKKSEPKKWICEDCEHMVNPTTEDGSSYPICDHHACGGKPCGDTKSCSAYSKKHDTPMALLGHNDPEMVTPVIKDSGNRREFETGAVRDIQEGKGRCDLLPLDVVSNILNSAAIYNISEFINTNDLIYLHRALSTSNIFDNCHTMLLEVSKHFEEGCKKYGENNWRKGIPTRCYIDSAVRHYLKYLRGDRDEPHDRAFCWNILCCIWTCIHKPELNDYRKEEDNKNDG